MFHKCALPLLDDTTCKTSVQFDFAVKKKELKTQKLNTSPFTKCFHLIMTK